MRTADRLGKGIRTSARDALLADESTPENRGRVFGFHRMMDTTGAALGPLAALLFLSASPGNYTELFYFSAIPGIFALALSFRLKESKNRPKHATERKKTGFTDYIKYWKNSNSNYRKTVGGLVAFSLFNSSDVFLLLLLKSKGFSDVSVIGVYIFYNLIYAALSYPFGRLSDRLGYRKIFMLGLAGFAITYASISFVDNYYGIIGLFGIYGAYAALTEGTSRAWISNLCRPEEKATAFGFYNSFSSFALIIASTLTGFIWDYTLPVYCFTVSAIGAVLCLVYFSAIKQD